MRNKNLIKLVLAAMFIALCFVGANIKIFSSIAMDSLPAFIGTLFLGYGWGFAIGALAHVLTAITSGFPFGLPAHIITAVMMGLTMVGYLFTFNKLKDKNRVLAYVLASIAAVIINGPLALTCLVPIFTAPVAYGLLPVLVPAAAVNVALASVIHGLLPEKVKNLMK